jgi:hypothetical protein
MNGTSTAATIVGKPLAIWSWYCGYLCVDQLSSLTLAGMGSPGKVRQKFPLLRV